MPAACTPARVDSRTASARRSNLGSKWTVHAESMIRPLMCVPKSILHTSPYCSTVLSPELGVQCAATWLSGAARRKGDARLEAVLLHQRAVQVLELLAYVGHEHARFDHRLHVLAHLPMALGRRSDLLVRDVVEPLELTLLGVGDARLLVARVLHLHPVRHLARGELLEHGHRQAPLATVPLRLAALLWRRVRAPWLDAADDRRPLSRCGVDGHTTAIRSGLRSGRLLPSLGSLFLFALLLGRADAASLASSPPSPPSPAGSSPSSSSLRTHPSHQEGLHQYLQRPPPGPRARCPCSFFFLLLLSAHAGSSREQRQRRRVSKEEEKGSAVWGMLWTTLFPGRRIAVLGVIDFNLDVIGLLIFGNRPRVAHVHRFSGARHTDTNWAEGCSRSSAFLLLAGSGASTRDLLGFRKLHTRT